MAAAARRGGYGGGGRMSRSPGVILNLPLPQHSDSSAAAVVPDMFTLCMSRGHPPLPDARQQNNTLHKQVKGGYLLRYKRGFFCKGWLEEWVVLYDDSTIAWYAEKGLSRPRGFIRISDAPELLAVGQWTMKVPKRPRFPSTYHIGQLLAIGSRYHRHVQWLMAESPTEINDWMTAISNTLPPPLESKRLSITPQQNGVLDNHHHMANGCASALRNGNCHRALPDPNQRSKKREADYTMLSGVCIDWGHGWGWGQNAHAVCHESAVATSVYCHSSDDCTGLDGYDAVDWSAFGDFSF